MKQTKYQKHFFNIQLFAEGGDGGAEGGTGAGETNGANGVGVPSLPTTAKKNAKSNPLADVKYGKQGSEEATESTVEAQETNVADKPIDRQAEFEKLIKGEYKDLYDARVQNTIQQRLKGSKDIADKYNALSPTLELLSKKYGVDATDIEALNKAITDDDAYYEDEALERGISVEQLKQIRNMERENAQLKAQVEQRNNQAKAEAEVAKWMQQAEEAKATFPNLDLNREISNPQFASLLKSGIDVSTAYFAVHNKELVPQAMQYTAKAVEEKIANKIASQGRVPAENGITSSATAIVKSDVSQLTKADRAEIARRVARGEKISF